MQVCCVGIVLGQYYVGGEISYDPRIASLFVDIEVIDLTSEDEGPREDPEECQGKGTSKGEEIETMEGGSVDASSEARVKEITVMIEVDGHPAHALFDTGSTHSYVDEAYAEEKGLTLEKFRKGKTVRYADGSESTMNWVCRNCPVTVGGMCTRADLTASKIKPLDVLMGMDWLSAHYAHIDCRKGEIEFRIPGRPIFKLQGDRGRR